MFTSPTLFYTPPPNPPAQNFKFLEITLSRREGGRECGTTETETEAERHKDKERQSQRKTQRVKQLKRNRERERVMLTKTLC